MSRYKNKSSPLKFKVIAEAGHGFHSMGSDGKITPLPIETELELAIQEPQKYIKSLMTLAEYYSNQRGVVSTVLDLMQDFSASDFENDTDDKDVKSFYDDIKEDLGLVKVIEEQFKTYYVDANVYPYVYWDNGLPTYIDLLNPLQVDVGGRVLTNKTQLFLTPSMELREVVDDLDNNPVMKSIYQSLPPEIKKGLQRDQEKIPLNPDNTYHIARKKRRFERYGVPFLTRIFEDLATYQLFRDMEKDTAKNIINALTLFTVGTDEHPAGQKQIDAVADLIKKKTQTYKLVWNHTLKVEIVTPDPEIFNQEKYKQVREDILDGLGMSRVLISGEGASYGTAWVSILAVIERMENARADIKRWINDFYTDIAIKNDIPLEKIPVVRFDKVNLRDEKVVQNILLRMYEKGLLSAKSTIEDSGYDFETEMKNRENEIENYQVQLTPPENPNTHSDKGRPEEVTTENPDKSTNNPEPSN